MDVPLMLSDLRSMDGEPRMLDLRLAERLGFERPRVIRELIARNADELEAQGVLPCRTANSQDPLGRGRPGTEYWLNRAQLIIVCMKSETQNAEAVRAEIVSVFEAYLDGTLVVAPGGSPQLVTVDLFNRVIEPLRRDVVEIKGNVVQLRTTQVEHGESIDEIRTHVTQIGHDTAHLHNRKRSEFSETKVIEPIVAFVLEYANGLCLRCREIKIVDQAGNKLPTFAADHWSGPQSNAIGNCFPVCHKCNQALKDDDNRERAAPRFRIFQEDLRKWLPAYWERRRSDKAACDALKKSEEEAAKPQLRLPI